MEERLNSQIEKIIIHEINSILRAHLSRNPLFSEHNVTDLESFSGFEYDDGHSISQNIGLRFGDESDMLSSSRDSTSKRLKRDVELQICRMRPDSQIIYGQYTHFLIGSEDIRLSILPRHKELYFIPLFFQDPSKIFYDDQELMDPGLLRGNTKTLTQYYMDGTKPQKNIFSDYSWSLYSNLFKLYDREESLDFLLHNRACEINGTTISGTQYVGLLFVNKS